MAVSDRQIITAYENKTLFNVGLIKDNSKKVPHMHYVSGIGEQWKRDVLINNEKCS